MCFYETKKAKKLQTVTLLYGVSFVWLYTNYTRFKSDYKLHFIMYTYFDLYFLNMLYSGCLSNSNLNPVIWLIQKHATICLQNTCHPMQFAYEPPDKTSGGMWAQQTQISLGIHPITLWWFCCVVAHICFENIRQITVLYTKADNLRHGHVRVKRK